MSDPMLFQFIGESIDGALNTYANTASSNVAAMFITLAVSLTTLHYVLMGFMMMLGRVESPWSSFMVSAGKFLLVSLLALNASIYLSWVVEAIRGLEVALTAAFAGSHGTAPDSVYGVIDQSLGKGWALAGDLWEKASNRGWREMGMAFGEYFNAIIIALATGIIGFPAGAMILTAKAVLSLMLGIGPLFIMLLMWPVTKQFFDRWIGVVMMTILQIALLAAVLTFAIQMFAVVVDSVDLDSSTDSPFFGSLRLLGFTVVMLWLLYFVNSIASQLSGGIAAAATTFGQLARGAMSPVRTANNIINPTSNRLDPRTGLQTQSSRLEHLAMGRSYFARNPAYRQATMERLRDAWRGPAGGNVKKG